MGFETFATNLGSDAVTQGIAFVSDFRTVLGILAGIGIMGMMFRLVRAALT